MGLLSVLVFPPYAELLRRELGGMLYLIVIHTLVRVILASLFVCFCCVELLGGERRSGTKRESLKLWSSVGVLKGEMDFQRQASLA